MPPLPAAICVAEEVGARLGVGLVLQRRLPPRQNSGQKMSTLWMIHVAVTWALVGLIWTIQMVHYPLFKQVGEEQFSRYHNWHMARIVWLVGPLMLVEAGTAAVLLYCGEHSLLFLLSVAALAVIWGSTVWLQVPLHQRLVAGYEQRLIHRLVRSNWWRTLAWTVRGICLIALLVPRL